MLKAGTERSAVPEPSTGEEDWTLLYGLVIGLTAFSTFVFSGVGFTTYTNVDFKKVFKIKPKITR